MSEATRDVSRLRELTVPPAKPIVLNSRPEQVSAGVWYEAVIRVISFDIRPWMGYLSLIWLRTVEGKCCQLGRMIEWLGSGDKRYIIRGCAPNKVTHAVLGLRINCEGAHTYARKVHVEIDDLDQSLITAAEETAIRRARLRTRQRRPTSTIDLNIEIVSYCNLRCIWCSLDHSKPRQTMTPELFDSVLSQAPYSNMPVRRIDLHNAGETLLHPRFDAMMRILASARSGYHDWPYTGLLTNATALDKSTCEAILNNKCIDLIRFSVDGGNRDEFETIRKGASWEHTSNNIKRFVAVNDELGHLVATGIICMVDQSRPLTTEWMGQEFREILSLVDFVEMRHPHKWDGSVDLGLSESPREQECLSGGGLCSFMDNNNLVVLPNGGVTVCCADLNSRGVVGTIGMGLTKLAKCGERRRMIHLMKAKRRKDIPLCAHCVLR